MSFEFSDEEFYVLDCLSEDSYAFSELVWLGTTARQTEKAPRLLLSFLHSGLIEVFERREHNAGDERRLSREEAEAAILDERNWRDPLQEDMSGRWYEAFRTEAGWEAYARALEERHPA